MAVQKVIFLILLCSALPVVAQYGKDYNQLIWAEEFNYKGHPKTESWGYEVGHIRNKESQYYTRRDRRNVRVRNGCLEIVARREAKEPKDGSSRITSGSINTLGKQEFFYGRVEVRAKIPTGRGAWPAIWMMGTDRPQKGWPECGEIDIMENVGFDPAVFHATVHTPGSRKAPGRVKRSAQMKLSDAYTDFHVFALEWYPDRMDFFIDEKKVLTYDRREDLPEFWRFDKPQYLLLNLAVGGAWGGAKGIDETIFPLTYYIDWVRYYK